MAQREIDPLENEIIGTAIKNTEAEMFRQATDAEEPSEGDEEGDQSLEEMGDGLEGQVEKTEEDEAGDDAEDEVEGEKVEAEKPEGKGEEAPRDDKGRFAPEGEAEKKGDVQVPLKVARQQAREADERAKTAETERDAVKTEMATLNAKLDGILAGLNRPVQQPPKPQEQPQKPDMFADPEGYEKWLRADIERGHQERQQATESRLVEASMADAHELHGEKFVKAYQAITSQSPQDPAARALVARIWSSPNPGRAMMNWWQQQETLREVGTDPGKYKERIAAETREALMKDPEFRKQLLAELKGQASGANGGQPKNVTRIPKSLSEASGGSSARERGGENDGSDRVIFESIFENQG
jgi:hypothetical protein